MANDKDAEISGFLNSPDGENLQEILSGVARTPPLTEFVDSFRNKTDQFLHDRLTAVIPERVDEALKAPNGQFRDLAMSHQRLEEKLGAQSSAFQELEVRAETLKMSVANVDKSFNAFKEAVSERIALKGVGDLWRTRSKSNKNSFVISFIVLVSLILLAPILLVIFKADILNFIHDVEAPRGVVSGEPDYLALIGRLAFVSMPIVFYVWIIRLVSRFNARSMLLMDDATQRSTMLDTYLYLIQKDADVTEERKTVLEALFRAAPGYGSDANEPSAIADLLRIAGQQHK